MLRRFVLLLFFTALSLPIYAQPTLPDLPPQPGDNTPVDYSSSQLGHGLSGSYLISYLRDYFYYSQSAGKNYDNSRQYLYSKVDISGDQVYGLYTGFTATYDSTNTEVTASTQVYQSGAGINAEHLWPQSRFSEAGPMVYDLHHLFAAKIQANGDRSNYPFMNIDEADVTYWYLGASRLTTPPASEEQYQYSKFKSNTGFEPRDQTKGDVARAIFYFYSMYKDDANMLAVIDNPVFFNGMKNTLLEWHRQDPVDSLEEARNDKVEIWQGNRNPFIDDSSLVARVFFSDDAFALDFAGDEAGWRMSALPFGLSYADVYGDVFTQGFTGATISTGSPNIYAWNTANGSFEAITNASSTATNQQGHIIYLFEDDDLNTAGIQGGFPKSVSVQGFTTSTSATMRLHAPDLNSSGTINTDEGWVLLQNPFDRAVSVSSLLDALETASSKSFNQNMYVWNASGMSYDTYAADSEELIAPFQGFWVKLDELSVSTSDIEITRSAVESTSSRVLQKSTVSLPMIQLLATENTYQSEVSFVFDDWSSNAYDAEDALYLEPFDTKSIRFYSVDDEKTAYQNQHINLNGLEELRIPIHLSNLNGSVKVFINGITKQDFLVFWSDGITETPLFDGVTLEISQNKLLATESIPLHYQPVLKTNEATTYSILIKRPVTTSIEQLFEKPSDLSISEAFPNPFNPSTSFSLNGTFKGDINWTVYSVLGQQMATGTTTKQGSTEQVRLNFSTYAAGLYMVQFRYGNEFVLKKALLVK